MHRWHIVYTVAGTPVRRGSLVLWADDAPAALEAARKLHRKLGAKASKGITYAEPVPYVKEAAA